MQNTNCKRTGEAFIAIGNSEFKFDHMKERNLKKRFSVGKFLRWDVWFKCKWQRQLEELKDRLNSKDMENVHSLTFLIDTHGKEGAFFDLSDRLISTKTARRRFLDALRIIKEHYLDKHKDNKMYFKINACHGAHKFDIKNNEEQDVYKLLIQELQANNLTNRVYISKDMNTQTLDSVNKLLPFLRGKKLEFFYEGAYTNANKQATNGTTNDNMTYNNYLRQQKTHFWVHKQLKCFLDYHIKNYKTLSIGEIRYKLYEIFDKQLAAESKKNINNIVIKNNNCYPLYGAIRKYYCPLNEYEKRFGNDSLANNTKKEFWGTTVGERRKRKEEKDKWLGRKPYNSQAEIMSISKNIQQEK